MKFLKRYSLLFNIALLSLFVYSCMDSTDSDDEQLTEFSSIEAPGDSAHAFLSDQQFSHLNVEIDYMPDYEPTQRGLDSLKSFLEQRLNKSSINIETPTRIESVGQNAYSGGDIVALEEEYRDHFTSAESDTLWAYLVIVDGEFTEQNVLGIAYLNTSMALFGPPIHNNSGSIGEADRYKLEATIMNHEFGHNIGLVANGSPMQEDHQDTENGHHCTDDSCLMYYATETADYTSILMDSPIPDLQEFCLADIEANR